MLLCVNLADSLDAARRTHELRQEALCGEASKVATCLFAGLKLSCEKQLPCSARVPFKLALSPGQSYRDRHH